MLADGVSSSWRKPSAPLCFDRAQRPPASTAMGLRVYECALPILRAATWLKGWTGCRPNFLSRIFVCGPTGAPDCCQQVVDGALNAALLLVPSGGALSGRFIGSLQTVIVQEDVSVALAGSAIGDQTAIEAGPLSQ
jgi:hypothetical protein